MKQFFNTDQTNNSHTNLEWERQLKNEEILQKENEKSFLLDFSNDMTAVRSQQDLALVVRKAFRKLNPDGGYVIRKLNPDGKTMSAYLYDTGAATFDKRLLEQVLTEKYPIDDGIQNRIMDSCIPLLFNVRWELERDHKLSYLDLWENMGFKTMVGIALRIGDKNAGLLLLSIGEINIAILQVSVRKSQLRWAISWPTRKYSGARLSRN